VLNELKQLKVLTTLRYEDQGSHNEGREAIVSAECVGLGTFKAEGIYTTKQVAK